MLMHDILQVEALFELLKEIIKDNHGAAAVDEVSSQKMCVSMVVRNTGANATGLYRLMRKTSWRNKIWLLGLYRCFSTMTIMLCSR